MRMTYGRELPNNERDALLGRRARDAISGGVDIPTKQETRKPVKPCR